MIQCTSDYMVQTAKFSTMHQIPLGYEPPLIMARHIRPNFTILSVSAQPFHIAPVLCFLLILSATYTHTHLKHTHTHTEYTEF